MKRETKVATESATPANPNDTVSNLSVAPPLATAGSSPRWGIRIKHLRLKGTETDYDVDFTDDNGQLRSLPLIAGAFSTGKSSVLEFIDYCLGAKDHPQHPEVLRRVRSALLEVELSGSPYVIERSVGEASSHAFVRPGQLGSIDVPPTERKNIRPPGDPTSLSSFLLSHCGLEGVELKEAPTQASSGTDPLSFRDLMWLCFLPNERLDDKNLLFESAYMKNLKLRQVFDVIFQVYDDRAAELGRQIKELESRVARARANHAAAQAFLDEQDLGTRLQVEAERDQADSEMRRLDGLLGSLNEEIIFASTFAAEARENHQRMAQRAQEAAALVRDRETQIRRLVPLRAQYADDLSKLTMLEEARRLFDPIRVTVCPACLSVLNEEPYIADGACSLCHNQMAENPSTNQPESEEDGGVPSPVFDVSREIRSTRSRLTEVTRYIDDLDRALPQLRQRAASTSEEEASAARAVDAASRESIAPFLSRRDGLISSRASTASTLEQNRRALKMLDSLDRRASDVLRLEGALKALRAETAETAPRPDRNNIVTRISERFASILRSWRYPKIELAYIDSNLTPHMRGSDYRSASSGGRTLISLAWILSIFEIAYESNAKHPGFLMLDSPQKNLGQGGARDEEFADSVAVSDFYQHLHNWLSGAGAGAQIFVVDNSPPAVVDTDVVIRFSRDPSNPPYGLITDETS